MLIPYLNQMPMRHIVTVIAAALVTSPSFGVAAAGKKKTLESKVEMSSESESAVGNKADADRSAADNGENEESGDADVGDENAADGGGEEAVAGDEGEGAAVEVDVAVEEDSDAASNGGILATTFETDAVARRDRGINILTAHATRKGALTLVLDHRPYKNLFSKADAFYDYLGLDRGESLKVGLGLRYGIIDGLDAGLYRLNDGGLVKYDTYEFDVRYVILNQADFYVNLMARAGGSWFASEGNHALGGFFQLFVDHILFDRVLIGAGFAFHSESSSEYKDRDKNLGKDVDTISGAITAVVEWRALEFMAVTGELAAAVLGYKQDYPVATLALKFLTHRHTFSVMLTTGQFINADGIVANTWRTPKELIFGFQIFREFNLI